MVTKILGYAFLAFLLLALALTTATTLSLGRINSGLDSSLASVSQLVAVEHIVIQKNAALGDVIRTTQSMSSDLAVTLRSTRSIRNNISNIDNLNIATLNVNQDMTSQGNASAKQLMTMNSRVGLLVHSMSSVYQAISGLSQVIQNDQSNLHDLRMYVDDMDRKIPGVTAP